MKVITLLLVFVIAGCTQSPKTTPSQLQKPTTLLNHALFTPITVIDEASIFHLPDNEKRAFEAYVQKAQARQVRKDRIIAHYLESKLDHFSYDGATLSASAALKQKEGNCISLAILTQAYANLLGIETGFSEVATMPVYKRQGQTILISSHFKTKTLCTTRPRR